MSPRAARGVFVDYVQKTVSTENPWDCRALAAPHLEASLNM